MQFNPKFIITSSIANNLMKIEAARESVNTLPITTKMLSMLRETARLYSTHYSTAIEGNKLNQNQVIKVVNKSEHFPGKERDEEEVKGYYTALNELELLVKRKTKLTETIVKKFHALVMGKGRKNVKPTPYRDGQNVIKDGSTGSIVYMPPEAKDVQDLMSGLVAWIDKEGLPAPIKAAIVHYQFVTIHPYYDGNGRTARLFTTFLLHFGGYDLKGLYSLEEYYAKDLKSYYEALDVGPSHNYYMGRAESDITKWVEYFIAGMTESFNRVKQRAQEAADEGAEDKTDIIKKLDAKQRKTLTLFRKKYEITSSDVQKLFNYKPRTARALLAKWVTDGFLVITDPSNKARKYKLAEKYN